MIRLFALQILYTTFKRAHTREKKFAQSCGPFSREKKGEIVKEEQVKQTERSIKMLVNISVMLRLTLTMLAINSVHVNVDAAGSDIIGEFPMKI